MWIIMAINKTTEAIWVKYAYSILGTHTHTHGNMENKFNNTEPLEIMHNCIRQRHPPFRDYLYSTKQSWHTFNVLLDDLSNGSKLEPCPCWCWGDLVDIPWLKSFGLLRFVAILILQVKRNLQTLKLYKYTVNGLLRYATVPESVMNTPPNGYLSLLQSHNSKLIRHF